MTSIPVKTPKERAVIMLRFCDCYSRMSGIKSVFLVVVTFLLSPPARGDVEVSCVFNESCILPCRFQAGVDVVIHWIHETAGKVTVHSYYYNQDQFSHQNQRFRDRTSLFKDQISRGNASLRLTGVEFQDQGRYKCYTSTITGNKESFINLKVDDEEVSCVFMESCILPCRFQAGDDVVIHWIQVTAGNTQVHSYYYNQDQLFHQNECFRDRTSLFNDQISRGNASLRLTGVEFQDQGRYKCYTSTITGNKETFINLKVDAPVHKVNIQQVENKITCRSDRIYPEPELTWSTNPPSNMTLQNKAEVQQTEQQLYNIISSLILSDSAGDLTFICTVSTQTSSRRASLRTLHSSTNVAGIVGGVVGAVLGVLLMVLGVYCVRNRTAARDPQNPEPSNCISKNIPVKTPKERAVIMLRFCDCYSRMSGIKSVFLVVATFLFSPPARGDVEVSCVFMESCILPCRFQAGVYVVIHWIHETAGKVPVHSYYYNQDQLSHQNQRFRDRTSLFKDQISRGNASLRLTGVEFQDQGRYKCYTSTITGNKESFINLKVDDSSTNVEGIAIPVVVGAILFVVLMVLVVYWIYKKVRKNGPTDPQNSEPSNGVLEERHLSRRGSLMFIVSVHSVLLQIPVKTPKERAVIMLRVCDCYSRMSGIKSIFLVVMTFLLSPPAIADEEVSCVFMESCILPCGFQAGDHILIHWIQVTAGKVPVHSYYYNQDQLFHQNQRFRGRTSLFKDQISRGNASLRLTGVEFQDQGRYKCYTSTITGNKESFINVNMDGAETNIDIQQVENKITCRSDGIYPEPELTWSTNPPSNMTLQNKTEVQQTEQQLYNIISSLILSDSAGDLTYNCTVSTQTSSRRASLKTLHNSTNVAGIVSGVVGAIWCVFVGLVVYWIYKKVRKDRQTYQTEKGSPQNPEPSNGVSNSPEDILLNETENGGE
ncbi:uncharacterized protein [Thunnus thynnus]|uniref:uncharacterized protein n=1 Tax=Thunnus thynnus TaxID=8237 RepID=UPI003528DB45